MATIKIINDIEYDIDQMIDLNYVLTKSMEYVDKTGRERATKSQKFIRHTQIYIALKLQQLDIPLNDIHFETKLHNKEVDLCVFKDNSPFLVISIKSQSSSVKKNFTNTANVLQGEVASLKLSYPNLKVVTFILYKKTDSTLNENLTSYYSDKIPTKIFPIISPHYVHNSKFDMGGIILWDRDANGIEIDNTLFQDFNTDKFFDWIKNVYEGKQVYSQFTLSDLDAKIEEFLNDDNI